MKKYALLASFVSLSVLACNPPAGDPNADRNGDGISDPKGVREVDVVNQQAPSSPVGVVIGVLVDAYTGQPIANQTINVASGRGIQLTATTDEAGAFTIPSVAFGAYGFSVIREGYVPVSTVLYTENGEDMGLFPTDNFVNDLGTVHLLPSDSTYAVTVVTASGVIVANKEIIVEVGMAFSVRAGLGAGSYPIGRRTILATTDAQGVATVTGVPDVTKIYRVLAGGSDYGIFVTCGPVDVNGDSVYDFAGASYDVYNSDSVRDGRSKFTFVLEEASANDEPEIIASNTTNNNTNRPAVIATTDAIRVVYDQPIHAGSIIAAVTNDFPRLTPGGRVHDNSAIGFDRENNPEPALNLSTANNTVTATLDPSGSAVTLTGASAWPAGRILMVSLMVSSAQHAGGAGYVLHRLFVFVKPTADALSVEQTLLERAKVSPANGYKYSTLVVGFNQPIISADDGIYFCIDADLNNNGSRETNFVLDANECPLADSTRALNTNDVANLRRFNALSQFDSVTRWFGADLSGVPAFPNLDLNGGVAKLPDVYLLINPVINGTFTDPVSGSPTVAVDALFRPLPTQRVKAVFDVATSTLSQVAVGGTAVIANN